MRFTVVIPTLNEAPIIQEALRRVQRLAPHELIIADGGSRDGTRELARPHATVVTGRRGRGPQLNAGAAQATGDVVVFLHADVRLPPDAFAAIESALVDEDVVGGCFRVRFGRGPHEAFLAVFYDLLRFGARGIVYGDAAVFVRRETFLGLGGFRDYAIMEDVNLVSRLRGRGRVVQLPQAVIASTRRWRHGGFWRTWASWFALQALYGLRVSPYWLGRMYRAVR